MSGFNKTAWLKLQKVYGIPGNEFSVEGWLLVQDLYKDIKWAKKIETQRKNLTRTSSACSYNGG